MLTFLNLTDKLLSHNIGGKIMKNRVREALVLRNMKQAELAERSGIRAESPLRHIFQ